MSKPANVELPKIQTLLDQHFGPLNWWPAETPFEVAVGAILTQNTAWTNVEYAIENLKTASLLTPGKIAELPLKQLQELIKPSGFYRQKASRLKHLAGHVVSRWQGDIIALCSGPLDEARSRLLALPGIGPETADSILLYAAERPSFVVDAYTRRIFQRVGILHGKETYDEIRGVFMRNLPEDIQLYNEYHAQIVHLAKSYCSKNQPDCKACPIRSHCSHGFDSATAGENVRFP